MDGQEGLQERGEQAFKIKKRGGRIERRGGGMEKRGKGREEESKQCCPLVIQDCKAQKYQKLRQKNPAVLTLFLLPSLVKPKRNWVVW